MASELHAQDSTINEEEAFNLLAEKWLRGVKSAVNELFGPEKTTDLLDIWK